MYRGLIFETMLSSQKKTIKPAVRVNPQSDKDGSGSIQALKCAKILREGIGCSRDLFSSVQDIKENVICGIQVKPLILNSGPSLLDVNLQLPERPRIRTACSSENILADPQCPRT